MMPTFLPLDKMKCVEKLREIEVIWADLSKDEGKLKSPAWHEEALLDAKRAVERGKAKFSDWDTAKERIRRKAAKLV